MAKIKVAVLRGGPGVGYEESLKTGGHILSVLRGPLESYEPVDIFISKDGEWHRDGLVYEPHHALKHVDAAWNALHGPYGEDGQVQRILESLKIPYTGSGATASALSLDKHFSKDIYRRHSLLTPEHELLTKETLSDDKLIAIFRTYLHPVIVKPANSASSVGIRLVHAFNELRDAVREALESSPRVMVEEYVRGDSATCVVVEGARGEKFYTLIPSSDYGAARSEENRLMESMARQAHEALGLRHYSGSDFIITPRKRVYILETNSLPALHEDSPAHISLHTTGWKSHEFVDHVLKLVA